MPRRETLVSKEATHEEPFDLAFCSFTSRMSIGGTGRPKEDVTATTRAWADAVNSHDSERVVVLYDPEAVLSGTSSPTIRDSPYATISGRCPRFRQNTKSG